MGRLDGRVALVTGAASGIGAACVSRFRDEGAAVVTLDLAGDVDHTVDVTDEDAVHSAIAATLAMHDRLGIVVTSAGVAGGGPVHLLDEAEWDRVIAVNLTGTFLVSKHALAPMVEQGSGSIVNVSSVEGIEGTEGGSTYNASKAGVVMLTKNMAIAYGSKGIRSNCICPGFIQTPLLSSVLDSPGMEVYRERIRADHKLGRFGRPEEIAGAALFLASDDPSFVTGHALVVDGGYTAGRRPGMLE